MKTIALCLVIFTAFTSTVFAGNNKTGFEIELAQAERLLLETAHAFPKVGEAISVSTEPYTPLRHSSAVVVLIKKGSSIITDSFNCFATPNLYCYRGTPANKISEQDLRGMVIPARMFLLEAVNRHSYDHWSGPQLFHCEDDDQWVEDCKWDWVCDTTGLVPDSCRYVYTCWNHIVHTHKCECIQHCYD
ncbi:MAG: hypothetical protein WCK75_10920 [Elusimicrobiota bacterium]